MVDAVAIPCRNAAWNSPPAVLTWLEITCDDEPLIYCVECRRREFGADTSRA
jgi:hypothetical protein